MGAALFQLKRYREAIDAYHMVNEPQGWQLAYIAACHAHLAERHEAELAIARVLEMSPCLTISMMLKIEPYQTEDARHHLADGLRKAGLPE